MTIIASSQHSQDAISRSDDMHPIITVRASSWVTQPNGSSFHFSGYRQATIRQVIELEANPNRERRPSCGMDERTRGEKLREWLQLLTTQPTDALALLRINRHPPMVSWHYDDSDDWGGKRWHRALAEQKHELWSTRSLQVVPEKPPVKQVQPDYIPRFLLEAQQSSINSPSTDDGGLPASARTYNVNL